MTVWKRTERRPVKRVYELAQKLVDDDIRAAEWRELQALLKHDEKVRQAYVESMLLHASLVYLGREKAIGQQRQPGRHSAVGPKVGDMSTHRLDLAGVAGERGAAVPFGLRNRS